MKLRALTVLSLVAGAALVVSAQQPPTQPAPNRSAGYKERTHDVPTPGMLRGLRTEAGPRPTIDATGVVVPAPAVWDIDPLTGAQYRRGQVLVRFSASASEPLRASSLRRSGARRVARTLPGSWSLVELEPGAAARDAVRVLRTRAGVVNASLNYRREHQQFRPNDEHYGLQWNFDAINLPVAWQINPGARNDVIVAVIDTGLNFVTDTLVYFSPFVGQIPIRFAEVPDLVTPERIVAPYDFVYDDGIPVDLDGHGTHVAGTIAQQTNNNMGLAGIAYNVRLMPLKVLAGGSTAWDHILNPEHPGGSDAIIADAIRHAADNGAQVINLSLGGPGPAPILRDAISYAVSRGAFVAIAAGNSGDEENPVEYPAAYAEEIRGAMTVGAVNRDLRRAEYSSFHPYVEICAPGGETLVPLDFQRGVTQISYNDDATLFFFSLEEKFLALTLGLRPRFDQFEPVPFQGTSMATPHVAGLAALLYSQGIRDPRAIEQAIKQFAAPISATSDECGAGLIDARRALRGLGLSR